MKSISFAAVVTVLLTLAPPCLAQSFAGGGFSFGAVPDSHNGQNTAVGGFVEGALSRRYRLRFDLTGLGIVEYAPKAGYDGGVDFRLRPEIRIVDPSERKVKVFAGLGFQFNRFHSLQYGKSGLNHTATLGAEVARLHALRISRLFEDRTGLNLNGLQGWRAGYDLTRPFRSSRWGIRFSVEVNRFKYKQLTGPGIGSYTDHSLAVRFGVVKTR